MLLPLWVQLFGQEDSHQELDSLSFDDEDLVGASSFWRFLMTSALGLNLTRAGSLRLLSFSSSPAISSFSDAQGSSSGGDSASSHLCPVDLPLPLGVLVEPLPPEHFFSHAA